MKVKPPQHAFRVSTDAVRLEYRRNRATAVRHQIQRRERLAAELAQSAAVVIPRETGYVICGPGTFDEVSSILETACDVLAHVDLEEKRAKANKPFMIKLVKMDSLTEDSPLLRFALRRDIIASAARYLGIVPILQYANVMYSSPTGTDPVKSQLYHCDSDEAEQVKVFILCEEVTPSTGPLTFVPASQSQLIRDRLNYKYNTRVTDQLLRDAAAEGLHETRLIGSAGTTAFLDTSRCFHYGSRFNDPSARRVVAMLQYVTPLAFVLPEQNYPDGATFRHLARPDHHEITSMVLGAA